MTASRFSIRLATLPDAECIAQFNIAMAYETEGKLLKPEVVLAGVQSLLRAGDAGFYLVAVAGDVLVGCLMVTYEWSDWRNGQFWWIQSVYVQPDHRRKGVFRQLYREARRMALGEDRVCGLRLYVERDNESAQSTYRGLGMLQTPYRMFEEEFNSIARSE